MLYSWSNRLARRLRSQGQGGHSNSAAIDRFMSLPLELQVQIVSHLSPDDLIKVIRILNACDPSNCLSRAVDIIERPSDLKRRSWKPIKVIFITPLFNSESHYWTLVKRCEKSLNFVFFISEHEQCSPSMEWLQKLLTDQTIGHRTKVHISGGMQNISFQCLVITSCGLYSESLTHLTFKRCQIPNGHKFKLGGKLTWKEPRSRSTLKLAHCSQEFIDNLNLDELWSIEIFEIFTHARLSVRDKSLNFLRCGFYSEGMNSLRNCVFLGEHLTVKHVGRSNMDDNTESIGTEIRDLKSPNMRSMNVEFLGSFSPANIQAGSLEFVFLNSTSRHHPQKVLKQDDYSFLSRVMTLELSGSYDPSILLKCTFSRFLRALRLAAPWPGFGNWWGGVLDESIPSIPPSSYFPPNNGITKHLNYALVSSGLARRSKRRKTPFIRFF